MERLLRGTIVRGGVRDAAPDAGAGFPEGSSDGGVVHAGPEAKGSAIGAIMGKVEGGGDGREDRDGRGRWVGGIKHGGFLREVGGQAGAIGYGGGG